MKPITFTHIDGPNTLTVTAKYHPARLGTRYDEPEPASIDILTVTCDGEEYECEEWLLEKLESEGLEVVEQEKYSEI